MDQFEVTTFNLDIVLLQINLIIRKQLMTRITIKITIIIIICYILELLT